MNKVSQNHIHARSADGELFILGFNSVQDLFRFSACIRGVKVSHVVVRFENMNRGGSLPLECQQVYNLRRFSRLRLSFRRRISLGEYCDGIDQALTY